MEQEYIDVTPTWTTAAKLYAHVMAEGTAEGLENVIHELQGVEYMLADYASPENMVIGAAS